MTNEHVIIDMLPPTDEPTSLKKWGGVRYHRGKSNAVDDRTTKVNAAIK